MVPGIETPAPPGRLTGQGAQGVPGVTRAVTLRPEQPSGGWSPAADVPDEVRADQDGDADATNEEDQHPDGVQVGRDQPERADDQPEQDDQGNRSDVSASHMPEGLRWGNSSSPALRC